MENSNRRFPNVQGAEDDKDRVQGLDAKNEESYLTLQDCDKTTSLPQNIDTVEEHSRSDNEHITVNDSSPSASPPRKKLLADLKEKMVNEERAQKMKLSHEIAFDSNFKLPDVPEQLPEDDKSPKANLKRFEKEIKEIVHRAFWDCLRAGIESDPPSYTHAFILLQEIKETLLALLPQNRTTSIHQRIEEYMDMDFLRQQADNETLDVKSIATFIVDTMHCMCAPVRDDQVAGLRSIHDVVDLFKGIYEVLGVMKIDLANMAITSIRPYLQQQQFEYERTQFAELYKTSSDLKYTRKWIHTTFEKVQVELQQILQQLEKSSSSLAPSLDDDAQKKYSEIKKLKLYPFSVLKEAYGSILSDDLHLDELPETLKMDRERICELRQEVNMIVLASAVMLTCCGVFGQPIASHKEFLMKLKKDIMTLTVSDHNSNISDMLERIALQCWKDAVEYCKDKDPNVSKCVRISNESVLQNQISALKDKRNHPVYKLLYTRTVDYLQMTTDTLAQIHTTIPPTLPHPPAGLSFLTKELVTTALQFAKLVNMNKTIYGPFYAPILQGILDTVQPDNNAASTHLKKDITNSKSGAIKKLNFKSSSAEQTSHPPENTGKYKVTGSLEDLD